MRKDLAPNYGERRRSIRKRKKRKKRKEGGKEKDNDILEIVRCLLLGKKYKMQDAIH